ncbi:MAG TPA: ABC transporter substrate-binding protein [Solirubrobacterales bacterium]|nr:ABC transporter substrate-binding protein [Solirubrobacterales bacterium]
MTGIRLGALLAAIVFLAGCGEEEGSKTVVERNHPRELREVRVSINDYVGPEHAGLLMAEANGYFADAGFEVIADPPANPTWPVRYVLSDLVDSDFSVSHQPQVAISTDNGKPIVAVGSLISHPTAALIWLKESGIGSISALKGKVVGVPGLPFQVRFLEELLSRANLGPEDVKVKYVGYELVPSLVKGRVDAIFGGSAQLEGIELRSLGLEPVITPVRSLGIPDYEELVLIATTDLASREPQFIQEFLAALSRGTAAAIRNPQAVVREIESHVEPRPVSSRKARRAQVEAILPLLSPSGEMDESRVEGLAAWMHGEGMIREEPPVSSLLADE